MLANILAIGFLYLPAPPPNPKLKKKEKKQKALEVVIYSIRKCLIDHPLIFRYCTLSGCKNATFALVYLHVHVSSTSVRLKETPTEY